MSQKPEAPAAGQARCVAHLDMDAFYASVELLRYPELRGLPVVIGGGASTQPRMGADGRRVFARLRDYAGRGVVTTSTYEARQFGVFSAMGLMKSAQLAPDAILLPTDFAAYRDMSRRFKAAVASIAPHVEDRGIDEIYIELTDLPGEPSEIARAIKEAVKAATGLTCSIGLAPNKLLAKIASELDKPDGLTVLTPDLVMWRVWPLPASKINGIGPKASARLAGLGISTVGELAAAAPELLQANFGRSYARWLLDAAHGRDDRAVVIWSPPKSVSRETTFERDLHVQRDRALLSAHLEHLCERVAEDLRRKAVVGRTVGVKLRFDDFRIVTRDLTLPAATREAAAILMGVRQCLKRAPLERRLRLLGVRVGSLESEAPAGAAPRAEQLSLY